ncbi:hypothetical protein ACIO3O_36685 [Streptomyces sp. NPDC087440]|uniref:hypothetical protein n=1 Tax=Streptomyces sp. NPDC087440 TaxID=3365790 RepID=UPI0038140DE8
MTHPTAIPGYEGGPLTHRPELLDDPLFWLGHLVSCAQHEDAQELLLGADDDAAQEFHSRLWERADWPTFTVPLNGGHRLHVVYRTFPDDTGVDYLLDHPDWATADQLAQDDGHFMGPGLSWPELAAAADRTPPGGSTDDPHARLLLLLPALGDKALPDSATPRLAEALDARTAVDDPLRLATVLLDHQGAPGPAHWTHLTSSHAVNDGPLSFRNPANPFALPPSHLARVSTALAP